MRNNGRGDDPKTIWQNQPTEQSAMTLEKIQQKMRELHAKTSRQVVGTLSGPLAAVFFYAFGVRSFPALQNVLHPLFAFALAWSLVGLYFLNRGMWAAMPGDVGVSTGLEFSRQEVERQRYFLGRALLWSFGPVLLAIGTFILALAMIGTSDRGLIPNGLPFLTLVAVWIVGSFVLRLREQRKLKREIDELNDIARENSR